MPEALTFEAFYAGVGRAVRGVFPDAEEVEAYGMRGWQVPVPHPGPPVGTMDPAHLQVLPVLRAYGVTVHVWNPVSYTFLQDRAGPLEAAGFRVMKGCIEWNHRSGFPWPAFEALLRDAKASLG